MLYDGNVLSDDLTLEKLVTLTFQARFLNFLTRGRTEKQQITNKIAVNEFFPTVHYLHRLVCREKFVVLNSKNSISEVALF